jgi:predicted ATPase with chaperone activity
VLRLAQTVADLAGSETIGRDQMAQALQLRRRDQEGESFRSSTLTRP